MLIRPEQLDIMALKNLILKSFTFEEIQKQLEKINVKDENRVIYDELSDIKPQTDDSSKYNDYEILKDYKYRISTKILDYDLESFDNDLYQLVDDLGYMCNNPFEEVIDNSPSNTTILLDHGKDSRDLDIRITSYTHGAGMVVGGPAGGSTEEVIKDYRLKGSNTLEIVLPKKYMTYTEKSIYKYNNGDQFIIFLNNTDVRVILVTIY